jgi:hypothetical protein
LPADLSEHLEVPSERLAGASRRRSAETLRAVTSDYLAALDAALLALDRIGFLSSGRFTPCPHCVQNLQRKRAAMVKKQARRDERQPARDSRRRVVEARKAAYAKTLESGGTFAEAREAMQAVTRSPLSIPEGLDLMSAAPGKPAAGSLAAIGAMPPKPADPRQGAADARWSTRPKKSVIKSKKRNRSNK